VWGKAASSMSEYRRAAEVIRFLSKEIRTCELGGLWEIRTCEFFQQNAETILPGEFSAYSKILPGEFSPHAWGIMLCLIILKKFERSNFLKMQKFERSNFTPCAGVLLSFLEKISTVEFFQR
jgi:hypothetical protein